MAFRMLTGRDCLLVALIVATTALAGCPRPTGCSRRLGASCDGGPEASACVPGSAFPNAFCSSPGAVCSYFPSCPPYAPLNCTCLGSVWQCPADNCGFLDVPTIETSTICPSAPVNDRDFCGSSFRARSCPGLTTNCDGSSFYTSCYCDGTTWACTRPRCPDGGVDVIRTDAVDVPRPDVLSCPSEPRPGERCLPPIGCFYARDGGTCGAYCYCRADNVYVCEPAGCVDGGVTDGGGIDASLPDGSIDAPGGG